MKKEFNRIFKTSLVSWIVFIILGIFLFCKAEFTLRMISYIVGGALLLAIVPLTKHLLAKEKNYSNFEFMIEVFMVVAGIIIVINPELIASIIPILIGILMIVNGVSKLQLANALRARDIKTWTSTMILAVLIIAGGILFVINPFGGAVAITKMIGIFIIVYSVIDMIDFVIIHKNIKDIEEEVENVTLPSKNVKIIEEEE